MTNFLGTGIFWTTIVAIAAILSLATFIGRVWIWLLPYRFKAQARFYLAPALGLASLTIIASLAGRFLPLGNSIIVPCLVIILLIGALVCEKHINQIFYHSLIVSVFGIICGVSVLSPLFVFGAFNAHNDSFTYLVHANWLQEHAFGGVISPANVTPLTTQISLYQQVGLRMGGSFLFALAQALLNLRWSYEVYPAIIISAIAVCCLAMGFPLAQSLRPIPRHTRLALLALPAFTLGGLVSGANMGFLPQTVGLAFGAGLLFAFGPLLRWISIEGEGKPRSEIVKATIPIALLFAAAVFAYSELAPFLLVAILGSGFFLAFRFCIWRSILLYIGMLLMLVALLLNTEMIRAYTALKIQSGVVVGMAVDWPLLGYVAHAFGIHGSAFDGFQWSSSESLRSILFAIGVALSSLISLVVLVGWQAIARASLNGVFMPVTMVLMLFCAGIFYFRYFVPSPFPKGFGQSWNQFKLSEWAHPFVMVFTLFAMVHLRQRMKKYFTYVIALLFLIGLVSTMLIGVARITPLIQYYGGTQNLNRFYQEFRQTVLANCPPTARVYLALNGQHLKFRQMAIYYLPEREIASDWMDDVYIFFHLPVEHRTQTLSVGDCVVEPIAQGGWLNQGTIIGPFWIGVFDGWRIRISSVIGAYDRESDVNNWWHWVEHKVTFQLQPLFVPKEVAQAKLYFEYGTIGGNQNLTVSIRTRDGSSQDILLRSEGYPPAVFEGVIDLPPAKITEFSIETDGVASSLGNGDQRMAAFIVRNVKITSITP